MEKGTAAYFVFDLIQYCEKEASSFSSPDMQYRFFQRIMTVLRDVYVKYSGQGEMQSQQEEYDESDENHSAVYESWKSAAHHHLSRSLLRNRRLNSLKMMNFVSINIKVNTILKLGFLR